MTIATPGPGNVNLAGAIKLTGATLRQVDYWCSRGYVPGQRPVMGSGNPREFTPAQIERIRILLRASVLQQMPLNELADQMEASRNLFDVAS